MASIIRKLVSGDKFRFKEDGFDLDLTYIKHNIIAMGLPGEHLSSLWRNNSHKVAEYLNTRHGTHYMIYNLSGEKYDYSRYNHQVREFGFPDHHPPPLQLYQQCVEDAARWLAQNSENVVVVHCLAGRSRTGTIIAGLLLYLHDFDAAEEAIRFFNSQRSSKESDIVLPSQIRYVGYFERLLQSKSREELFNNPKRIMLKQVIIEPALSLEDSDGIGGKYTPVVFVDELQEPHKLFNKITYETFDQAQCSDIKLPIHTMIAGDIRIRFCHKAKDKAAFTKSVVKVTSNPINVAKSTKQYPYVTICRVSFNTNFVDENTPLVLEAKDLDAAFAGSLVTAKSDFVPPGLRVVLIFGPLDSTVSNNYIEEKSSVEQKLQQPSMMSAHNPSSGVTFIPSAPLTYPGQPVIYGAPPSNLKKVVGRVHSVVRLGLTKRNHTYRYDD